MVEYIEKSVFLPEGSLTAVHSTDVLVARAKISPSVGMKAYDQCR